MRVGTWNLERRAGPIAQAQRELLDGLAFDLMIVTEPGPGWTCLEGVVRSPALRPGTRGLESWVAIIGGGLSALEPALPYECLAATAIGDIAGETVIVMGSVLPWRAAPRHAPELTRAPESAAEMFERVLHRQVVELEKLKASYPHAVLLWAGDFNQSLDGPNLSGSARGRQLLEKALLRLELAAWNRSQPHARPGLRAIDLICGPIERSIKQLAVIPPRAADGRRLSDHAGYAVEFA